MVDDKKSTGTLALLVEYTAFAANGYGKIRILPVSHGFVYPFGKTIRPSCQRNARRNRLRQKWRIVSA